MGLALAKRQQPKHDNVELSKTTASSLLHVLKRAKTLFFLLSLLYPSRRRAIVALVVCINTTSTQKLLAFHRVQLLFNVHHFFGKHFASKNLLADQL